MHVTAPGTIQRVNDVGVQDVQENASSNVIGNATGGHSCIAIACADTSAVELRIVGVRNAVTRHGYELRLTKEGMPSRGCNTISFYRSPGGLKSPLCKSWKLGFDVSPELFSVR